MERVSPITHVPETMTITVQSPLDKLLVEQALLMSQELRLATFGAEPGRVLDQCEETAIVKGREMIRRGIETATQEFIDAAQKKGGHCGPVHAASVAITKARTPRPR